MRNKGFVIAILLMAFAAGSASAEEVIYFTNGTEMPIRSHKVEGDQIKVDLGDNGFMAFPKSVVEKIESAPGVMLMPSTGSNKMFPSDPSTRVFGAAPRQASSTWALPAQPGDDPQHSSMQAVGGVVSNAPYPEDTHPAARSLRVNNIPEMRGVNEIKAEGEVPGAPRKLANPSVKKKKVFTEIKAR
jgi:hypothetical protein